MFSETLGRTACCEICRSLHSCFHATVEESGALGVRWAALRKEARGSKTAKVWNVKIVETIVIRRGIYIPKKPTINALSRTRDLRWNWFVHVRRGPHFRALVPRLQRAAEPSTAAFPRTLPDFRRDLCLVLERRVPFFKKTLTAVLSSSSESHAEGAHRNRHLFRTPEGRLSHHRQCAHRAVEDTCAAYD